MEIKVSPSVKHVIHVKDGSAWKSYEFGVDKGVVVSVSFLDCSFSRVEVTNFDLRAILEITKQTDWTLEPKGEGK